jgi:hypothetical protein
MIKWKVNVKEYIPGQTTDTKEYFEIWSQAVNQEYITTGGILNEIGYGLYLSLLGVTGKNSIYNSPTRKQYIWFTSVNNLIKLNLVKYDIINYKYNLTSKGHVMLEVLARCLMGKGVPKI